MSNHSDPATKSDLAKVENKLSAEISDVKSDIVILKTDVSELKKDVSELKTDVSELKKDVSEIKTNINMIIDMISVMNDRMEQQHKKDSSRMEVLIEDAEERFLDTSVEQVSVNSDKIENHEGRIVDLEKFQLAA